MKLHLVFIMTTKDSWETIIPCKFKMIGIAAPNANYQDAKGNDSNQAYEDKATSNGSILDIRSVKPVEKLLCEKVIDSEVPD